MLTEQTLFSHAARDTLIHPVGNTVSVSNSLLTFLLIFIFLFFASFFFFFFSFFALSSLFWIFISYFLVLLRRMFSRLLQGLLLVGYFLMLPWDFLVLLRRFLIFRDFHINTLSEGALKSK